MGYVSSPWPLLFYQLVGHPFSLWGVSFWYLWCTCSNLYTIRVFAGGICDELSSGCVENKNTLTYCIYIYICCCYAAAKLVRFCGCVALCCWYAVVVLLFLVCCCCCCCYVAVTHLACRCNVACCVVALLLCCCCFSLKVFSFAIFAMVGTRFSCKLV